MTESVIVRQQRAAKPGPDKPIATAGLANVHRGRSLPRQPGTMPCPKPTGPETT